MLLNKHVKHKCEILKLIIHNEKNKNIFFHITLEQYKYMYVQYVYIHI